MYLLCRIVQTEPLEGYKVAPKVDPMQCSCTSGPGTKEVLSQEVATWNPSTARDLSLPEDNGTLYPKGIHALHVKDVEDCKHTCIVVICTNVKDVEDSKILVFNPG